MARAMVHNKDVVKTLWDIAVNTTYHIVNKYTSDLKQRKHHMNYGKGENQM